MNLTRRTFHCAFAAVLVAAMLPERARATVPPRDEALVLARATDIDLSARETAVVFAPVPPPRRPLQQPKRVKGEKPAALRTWAVLRDVVAADGALAYDLFLVLEGPDVFRPTTTSQPIGALELGTASGDKKPDDKVPDRREPIAFDVSEALAKLSKVRGYRMSYLRLLIVRRPVKDASGNETVPSDPKPPEIGTIELVRW